MVIHSNGIVISLIKIHGQWQNLLPLYRVKREFESSRVRTEYINNMVNTVRRIITIIHKS